MAQPAPKSTPPDSAKTPLRTPKTGRGKLRVGNPGNKGGGRKPEKFATFLKGLRDSPDVQAAIEAAATDETSRGFAPVLKVMTDYDDEKPGQKLDHRFPDLPKADAANRIAAILNSAVGRKSSNGNGVHTNGNGKHP